MFKKNKPCDLKSCENTGLLGTNSSLTSQHPFTLHVIYISFNVRHIIGDVRAEKQAVSVLAAICAATSIWISWHFSAPYSADTYRVLGMSHEGQQGCLNVSHVKNCVSLTYCRHPLSWMAYHGDVDIWICLSSFLSGKKLLKKVLPLNYANSHSV